MGTVIVPQPPRCATQRQAERASSEGGLKAGGRGIPSALASGLSLESLDPRQDRAKPSQGLTCEGQQDHLPTAEAPIAGEFEALRAPRRLRATHPKGT